MRILKEKLKIAPCQSIVVGGIGEWLQCGIQNDSIVLWYTVKDRATSKQSVDIYIVGTGQSVPDEATLHIGTVILNSYVWHVFVGKH